MAQTESEIVEGIGSDYAVKYGFSNPDEAKDYFFKSGRGLSHELVDAISSHKDEPDWMRSFRHRSLDYFLARPLPTWGGNVAGIDFENIYYYIKPTEKQADSWEDLPADIKDTFLAYSRRSAKEVQAHGGRVVALGKFREVAAGDIKPRNVLILVEWKSKEAFEGYCSDPKIADLHPHREKGAGDYIWHLFDKLDDLRPILNPK